MKIFCDLILVVAMQLYMVIKDIKVYSNCVDFIVYLTHFNTIEKNNIQEELMRETHAL